MPLFLKSSLNKPELLLNDQVHVAFLFLKEGEDPPGHRDDLTVIKSK